MEILLPQDIFLFGKETFLPLIKDLLEESNWEEPYFFESPEIKIIYPNDLKNIEDKTFNLKSPADIRSLLLCYFTGGSPKN
jgi:hypothetical protein